MPSTAPSAPPLSWPRPSRTRAAPKCRDPIDADFEGGCTARIYLISSEEQPVQPGCVDVVYVDVDGAGEGRDDLVSAIESGDGGKVDESPDLLTDVGHLTVDVTTAEFDPEEIETARANVRDIYGDNVQLHPWVSTALSGSDRDEAFDRATRAATELGQALGDEDLVRAPIDADFEGECTTRIYVTTPIS